MGPRCCRAAAAGDVDLRRGHRLGAGGVVQRVADQIVVGVQVGADHQQARQGRVAQPPALGLHILAQPTQLGLPHLRAFARAGLWRAVHLQPEVCPGITDAQRARAIGPKYARLILAHKPIRSQHLALDEGQGAVRHTTGVIELLRQHIQLAPGAAAGVALLVQGLEEAIDRQRVMRTPQVVGPVEAVTLEQIRRQLALLDVSPHGAVAGGVEGLVEGSVGGFTQAILGQKCQGVGDACGIVSVLDGHAEQRRQCVERGWLGYGTGWRGRSRRWDRA